MDVLEKLERAHGMGSAHPERRGTLYAQAADEIRKLHEQLAIANNRLSFKELSK